MSEVKAYTKVAAPRRWESTDFLTPKVFVHLFLVLGLLTMVSLFHVWSRVKVIDLTLEIAEGTKLLKDERQETNRLRLEVASLKTPARIEALAKGDLGMVLPTDQQLVIVK